MAEQKSFASACREFFGFRPGTGLADFAKELKTLTQADRNEMAPQLGAVLGCEVLPGEAK